MSHYSKIRTKLRNAGALIKALQDMGFTASQIQQHSKATRLHGYSGDLREDTAEIVIPKCYVGGAANDIGFKLQEDGTYQAIISEYDRNNRASNKNEHSRSCGGYNQAWLDKLNQRYAYNNLKEELSDQGFFIESESEEDGELFLEVGTHLFGS